MAASLTEQDPMNNVIRTTIEAMAAYWTQTPDLYPFAEFDIEHASVVVPPIRPDGKVVIRSSPKISRGYQFSAWEFPEVGMSENTRDELRVVHVGVKSPNGNDGELEIWWQWDPRGVQWIPRQIHYVTARSNPRPLMVF